MKIDRRENLIRRYLLGELAEADHTALEQELLIDRGKFDQVWAVENELVDSYVRGDMSRPARERFESHYLASCPYRKVRLSFFSYTYRNPVLTVNLPLLPIPLF
jgi:hypothetical protein